jgi:hypothetical protein
MLNTMYGWYLKEEVSCVFDTITITKTIHPNTTEELTLTSGTPAGVPDVVEGELKKLKLSTFNFIITRIFSTSIPPEPLMVEIMPDGDLLQGFTSVVYAPRVIEPATPILLTMDLHATVTHGPGNITNMFMVFEGIWIPKSQMDKFSDICFDIGQGLGAAIDELISTVKAGGVGGAGTPSFSSRRSSGRGPIGDGERAPYCKPRRF